MANNDYENDIDLIEKDSDDFFLDLIKERPCLYDKSSKDYHDKIVNENAMEDIAFIMNDTVENCESRWKKFQAAYAREKLVEEKESRSGAPASSRKCWPFFKRMHSFISPKEVSRSCYSNIPKKDADKNIINHSTLNKSKKSNANSMEPILINVQNAINEVRALKRLDRMPQVAQDNLEVMIGNIVTIKLSNLSPKTAKKKRKLIMKCLIEEDSESDI